MYLPIYYKEYKSGTAKWRGARTSLTVQWLRPCTSTVGGVDPIPGQGTKIPHAARHGQKLKIKKKFKNIKKPISVSG